MTKVLSRESKNLEVSVVSTRTVPYSDIDLTFTNNAVNGDVYKKKDVAAVKQAVKNLLLTNFLEKPFLPDFGGNLISQLFELAYDDIGDDIRDNVIRNIEVYEPRARVLDVVAKASPDYNSLDVSVTFQVINVGTIETVKATVSRLR